MYHCLNFVTEKENFPAAVLIRGLYIPESKIDLNGPGKLCKALGINKEQNAIDITKNEHFLVKDTSIKIDVEATPRIGIKVGTDKLWRFIAKDYQKYL